MLELLARLRTAVHDEAAAKHDESPGATAHFDYSELVDGPYQIISNAVEIGQVLTGLLKRRQPLRLIARQQGRGSETRLLDVDAARHCIHLKPLLVDADHAAVLRDGHVNLTAQHHELPLLFSVDVRVAKSRESIPCYEADYPEWMLLAQMRSSHRIHLAPKLDATLTCPLQGHEAIHARVLDISETGIGLLLPKAVVAVVAAQATLYPATLHTAEGDLGPLRLVPRYLGSAIGGPQRLGATLETDSEAQRQQLRRLILRQQTLAAPKE